MFQQRKSPGYKYRANDFRFDALPAACSKLAANMSDLIGRPTPAFTHNKSSQTELRANMVKALTIEESTSQCGVFVA
jgi:hypothetical protein